MCPIVSSCFWLCLLCLVVSCWNQLHLFASDCCCLSLVLSSCTQLCLVVVLSPYLLLLPAVSCGILLCLIAPSCPICLVVSLYQPSSLILLRLVVFNWSLVCLFMSGCLMACTVDCLLKLDIFAKLPFI